MIDAWGGWALFQELLAGLKRIADRHGVSLANIAARYILEQPAVAGVIVGARLGLSQHREDNAQVFAAALDDADRGGHWGNNRPGPGFAGLDWRLRR